MTDFLAELATVKSGCLIYIYIYINIGLLRKPALAKQVGGLARSLDRYFYNLRFLLARTGADL